MTINLRKTFARVVYFIDQINKGKSRESILKELELSEQEFQFLLDTMLEISSFQDNDAYVVAQNIENDVCIGGAYIQKKYKNYLSL